MQVEHPLPRTAERPAAARPISGAGRTAGLYGEVVALPESRRAARTDRKAAV